MKLLALRIHEHDSNISYFDGKCVKYFSTERYFSEKHHSIIPSELLQKNPDLNLVSNYIKKLNNLLNTVFSISVADVDVIGIVVGDYWFTNELFVKKELGFNKPTFIIDHHLAHHFSTWPVEKPTTYGFVFDGQGNNCITHSLFKNGKLIDYFDRHRDGSIASRMKLIGRSLRFSGAFESQNKELDLAGKVMGYQSYGTINYDFYQHLNSFTLKDVYEAWTYPYFGQQISYIDWLRTVHEWTGDRLVNYFSKHKGTKSFTGGTAQSSVFNGKLYKHFDMEFSPTVSDAGLSLGVLEILRLIKGVEPFPTDGFPFWQCTDESPELTDKTQIKKIAEQLAKGKIVGVYQGQGEVGPRALGNRSILMDPSIKDGKDIINNKVKHRESFRPFGAACLLEDAELYFEAPKEIPYMNVNVDVKTDEFPSITHVDNSTRLQTVKNGVFYEILTEFKKLTGYGVLLNTSLNIAGKPIASKTEHAKQIFNSTELDAIFCGNEAQLK